MSENGRRPLLQLKSTPAVAKPEPAAAGWKCRPCGAAFEAPPAGSQEEWVRCPACNARLGRVADFLAEPPNVEKLRARPVTPRAKPAEKPAAEKLQMFRRRTASGGLRRAKDVPEA